MIIVTPTNDPHADFDHWDREQQREVDRLPRCAECHEPIFSDECYEIDEGKLICPDCLEDLRRNTEDYID